MAGEEHFSSSGFHVLSETVCRDYVTVVCSEPRSQGFSHDMSLLVLLFLLSG